MRLLLFPFILLYRILDRAIGAQLVGHGVALFGAVLAILGTTAMSWQHFVLADVTTLGYQVPPAGQIVLALSVLAALVAVGGMISRRRAGFAGGLLFISACVIAWVILSHTTRLTVFETLQFEQVEMLTGHTFATIGAFVMFLGALMVLASEPRVSPNADLLRVAMLWNGTVLKEQVLRQPRTLDVGEHFRNSLVVPAAALPVRFPLFKANRAGKYWIGITPDLQGDVTIKGDTQSVTAFAGQATEKSNGVDYVPIQRGDWGTISLGEASVFFQFVKPARPVAAPVFAFQEVLFASVIVSAFIHLFFITYGILGWEEKADREVKANMRKPMLVSIKTKAEEIIEEEKKEEEKEEEELKEEKDDEKFEDVDESVEKVEDAKRDDGRIPDKVNRRKGLTDLLKRGKNLGGAVASIMGGGAQGITNKIAVAMDGEGTGFALEGGPGGFGFAGGGTGGGPGGGYGARFASAGRIGTGGSLGVKAGLGKKKKRKVGKLNIGKSATTGFCKKSNISSVVRRRAGAIRACYEKRLQVKPNLSGKLTARWTIKLDGSVSGVSAGGSLSDGNVKNCILRVLRRMRFAKPEGGICIVKWPFVFSRGG